MNKSAMVTSRYRAKWHDGARPHGKRDQSDNWKGEILE
ncbi:hypothetical protein SAMN05216281_10810 [Cryobacterium luteum]|nr:hypothetical protein SAMN05216281_10810 [Cryobacterium luteum]